MPFGGRGMFGHRPGMMGGGTFGGTSLLDILAEQLGLTMDEVVDELSAGISVADLAANHNVDVQVIVDAFLAAHQEALSAAVENGRLTQEQADAMQEHMAEEIAERVNEPWTGRMGPGMMGHWGDPESIPEDKPFGSHGMFGRGMFGGGTSSLLDILAEQLGLTLDEVVDELSAGISIADLAANHNVDVQVIVDAFLAAHQEALSAAVENGRLTQEQADAMQEHMAEQIAERVNEPWTGSYGPGGGFRGGCGGGGMGGRWNGSGSNGSAAPMRGLSTGSSL
jgi:ATPase subunit of ABC transporter with duplicated ATPase domains